MTNDERNPKPECQRGLWCAMAPSSFGFRHCFGFRHSSFGFENHGSWRASCLAALLTLLMISPFAFTAQGATFTASLDRNTIAVNEGATLSLKFEGGLPAGIPALPNVPGLSFA